MTPASDTVYRPLLPMPGGPTTPTDGAMAVDCTVQQASNGRHLPPPTHQIRLDTSLDEAMPFLHAQQPLSRDGLIGPLDLNQLAFAQGRRAINQPRGGRREHHPARFHPLSHPHLLTDGGVTEWAGTDFTGDHLARVQAHPQQEVYTVALSDVDRKPLRLLFVCPTPPGRRGKRDPRTRLAR